MIEAAWNLIPLAQVTKSHPSLSHKQWNCVCLGLMSGLSFLDKYILDCVLESRQTVM